MILAPAPAPILKAIDDPQPDPARVAAAVAVLKPGLDLLQRFFQNLVDLENGDPTAATPAKLVAGLDPAGFSSSLSAAADGAALVAPEAKRELQAAKDAGTAVAAIVTKAQADHGQLESTHAESIIAAIGTQLEVVNIASWTVDPWRDPRS